MLVRSVMVAILYASATVLTSAGPTSVLALGLPALLSPELLDGPVSGTELTRTGKRASIVALRVCCCSSSSTPTTPVHSSSRETEVWAIKEGAISSTSRCSDGGFLTAQHLDREQRGQWMHFGQFRKPLKYLWEYNRQKRCCFIKS